MFQRRTTEQGRRGTAAAVAKVGATVAALSAATVVIRWATRRRAARSYLTEPLTDVGPVDMAVVKFTGNTFTGEVTPALLDLVETGTVRVLDALFVSRAADGTVNSLEIRDLGPDLKPAFVAIDGRPGVGMLDAEDVDRVGSTLDPDTSALLIVFENTWAAHFAGAARRAGGELVDITRIPSQAVAEVLDVLGSKPLGA